MSTEFKWFRSTETGKEGLYPARFASRPTFEEVGSDKAGCKDCQYEEEPVDEVTENDVEYSDEFTLNPEYADTETEDN